jgi:hypothetical protein
MGVAGKLATLGRLPLNGASNVVKAGAGAAGNLLNRTSRLFDTLGKRINRTSSSHHAPRRPPHRGKRC